MLIYCIAKKEGIKATDDEIDAAVKEYMESYNIESEEEVYKNLEKDDFEYRVISEKVMEMMKKEAKLVDSTEESTTESASEDEETSEETSEEK